MTTRPASSLRLRAHLSALGLAALTGAAASSASAEILTYYIGVDARTTPAAFGTYAGLPWANSGHLTVLIAHNVRDNPDDNHFHEAAIWTYTGPNLGAVTAIKTRADDYFPADSELPLALIAGTGAYAGKLVPQFTDLGGEGHNYSDLRIRPVSTLASFAEGTSEDILFHYAGDRWSTDLAGADLQLELVSLTASLHVGAADGSNFNVLSSPGDRVALGDGFDPGFWINPSSVGGTYTARFQVVDGAGLFGSSGIFEFRFAAEAVAIPEPATYAALLGVLAFGALQARRAARRG